MTILQEAKEFTLNPLGAMPARTSMPQPYTAEILDALPQAIVLLDSQCNIVYVNDAWKKIVRVAGIQSSAEDFQTFLSVIARDASQNGDLKAGLTAVLKDQRSAFTIEYALDIYGDSRCFVMHTRCIKHGRSAFVLTIHENISARKRIYQHLKRVSHALEQSPVSVIITDTHGNIEYFNHKFEQLTGYAATEVFGKNPNILQGKHTNPETYRELWQTLTSGKEWHGIFHNKKKNGEFFWEEAYISPLKDEKGEISHFIAVKQDITKRKVLEEQVRASERKFRTLFEQSRDAIGFCSFDDGILDMNPAGLNLFRCATLKELQQNHPPETWYCDSASFQQFKERLVKKGNISDHEMQLQVEPGKKITALISATLIDNKKEHPTSYQITIRDITDKKHFQQQLLQTREMEAIGTLAGGMAHEFNNILGAMLGYVELLRLDIQEGTARDNIEELFKSCKRAKAMVDHILNFGYKSEPKLEKVRLAALIQESVKLLKATMPETIRLQLDLQATTAVVNGDKVLLQQLIMNLATNALHAMHESGGTFTLILRQVKLSQVHPQLQAGEYLKLTVKDTGHGMDKHTLEQIFHPFFTTKPVGKGTALGLAVVHGIVKSHGGHITAQSAPGEGTAFVIYLPKAKEKFRKRKNGKSKIPVKGKGRILLVDDEETIIKVGKRLLNQLGYRVEVCSNPREAIAIFRKRPDAFDVLITDVTMPGVNGIQVAEQCRTLCPNLPVIFITGYGPPANTIQKNMAQKNLFLKKPFDIFELSETMQKAFLLKSVNENSKK